MQKLERLIAEQTGKTISIALHDLKTGQELLIDADESYHPASTFKVHVMMEVFHQAEQGFLALEDCLPIINCFTGVGDGGPFSLLESDDAEKTLYTRLGEREAIGELTRLMIVRSSNLATNILLEKIGVQSVNDFIQALGLAGVTVLRGIEDDAARRLGLNNRATARGLTQTMKLLAEGLVVSKQACKKMIEILLAQEFNESIPARLPPAVKVAHKTGWDDDVYHDTGIVYPENRPPYVLSIMTRGFRDEAEAYPCMAKLSKILYEMIQ